MSRLTALLAFALLPVCAMAQLSTEERRGISDALYLRNLTPADLDFVRRAKGDVAMPLVGEGIDHPLVAADALIRLHRSGGGDLATVLAAALAHLQTATAAPASSAVPLPPEVPIALRAPVERLVGAIAAANREIAASLGPLSAGERRILIDSLPQLAAGSGVKFGFAKGGPAPAAQVEALLKRVDVPRMLAAGSALATEVQAQLPALRAAKVSLNQSLSFKAAGVPVEIAGPEADSHGGVFAGLCIDLGGNDVYTGRYGAGTGNASVLIDLGGNDTYDVPDLSIGAGLLGVGLAYDLGGHDRFRGRSLTFGAGVAGVGCLYKDGGDDTYAGGSLSLGFGRSGAGIVLDTRGDDQYRCKGSGEGSGQVSGLGWLIDQNGNDVYLAAGDDSQGAGTGGLGLLSDMAGDDAYHGESNCQASGVSHGLGSLYDGAGTDEYVSGHASIAYAADAGGAYLFEMQGDDVYSARGGACLGTAQSRSVALLLDRAGNDLYAAGDGRPALATDGSLAIVVDGGGRDRYVGAPGGSVPGRMGDAIGLFVDLNGQDGYPEGLDDGTAKVEADGAIAYDVEGLAPAPPVDAFGPKPGTVADPGPVAIQALWDDLSPKASDQIVAIGVPALRWFADARLSVARPAEMAVAMRLVRALGESAKTVVVAKLNSPSEDEVRNALVLTGVAGALQAAPKVAALLKVPGLQRQAAETAGLIRATEAIPDLLPLAASPDPELALTAMLALERIGDQSALATAQALVVSQQFPIRQSAMRLLARFSASATTTAERLLADPDERVQRYGIELLGRMGSEDALLRVGKFLTAGSPGLKVQALLALNGQCPPVLRPTLMALRYDPSPAVRAVAIRIDPGR